ncbi:hypothetical protein L1987_50583 [Smallanthus sonchifolius]|uniref:Uncharacterized protein n=1 Tax=Smallanthus sonchifolius TaxID=185202 RepID=A0ACB9EMV7_9ASTR|nr:hypothetical protein L1987_50583 [Smallanthus sonchifolius]
MNRSRRQLPSEPPKRKGRDEAFDFLKPSTTIRPSRPPPPKPGPQAMATTKPLKPAAPQAMAQTRPFKAISPINMTPYYPKPMSPDNPFRSIPPQSTPFSPMPMASTNPSDVVALRTEAPSKALDRPPAQPDATPTSSNNSEAKGKGKAEAEPNPSMLDPQVKDLTYPEAAKLLMSGELRIPGIFNPSQLFQFLNRKPKNK